MSDPETRTVITQPEFIETADLLLDQAHSPSAELGDCANDAKKLLAALGDIAAETLVVEPPLSREQTGYYKKSAERVLALVQKSTDALAATDKRGRKGRRKPAPAQSTVAKTTFSGQGSDAKT